MKRSKLWKYGFPGAGRGVKIGSCCGDSAKALSFGAGCGGSFLGVFGYHARSDVEKCNSIGDRTGRCVGDS